MKDKLVVPPCSEDNDELALYISGFEDELENAQHPHVRAVLKKYRDQLEDNYREINFKMHDDN